jgi:hypothetical protein
MVEMDIGVRLCNKARRVAGIADNNPTARELRDGIVVSQPERPVALMPDPVGSITGDQFARAPNFRRTIGWYRANATHSPPLAFPASADLG